MRLTDTIAASVAHVVELLPTVPRNQQPPTHSIVGNVEPHLRCMIEAQFGPCIWRPNLGTECSAQIQINSGLVFEIVASNIPSESSLITMA